MQLNQPSTMSGLGKLATGLSVLSANLLAASPAWSEAGAAPSGLMQETAAPAGSTSFDSSVLFYQEQGGRIRAIEPVINGVINRANGDTLSGSVTYDSLTGATPNGAAPWTGQQTFTSVIKQGTSSTQTTTTTASGASTVTTIPGTGTATSSYVTPAQKVPLANFHDHRFAGNLGYSWLADADTRIKGGAAISVETDYSTISGNVGISHDFNQKNTTLTLDASYEQDTSRPHIGTPAPFQRLDSQITGGKDQKTIATVLLGVTQTMTRFWLTQLNYNYSSDQGYQSDPYRIISAVDATGAPLVYVFESRPRSRQRHSVYWGNKLALGPTVLDASARYYHDSWGINSITLELAEQIPLGHSIYIKPLGRYYHQSSANFYAPFLTGVGLQTTTITIPGTPGHGEDGAGGTPPVTTTQTVVTGLPNYASSDSRLSRFNAVTLGGRLGVQLGHGAEFYFIGEVYRQMGTHHVAGAPGALAGLDVFSGVHAVSLMSGVRITM
jgi:hypothetical protein